MTTATSSTYEANLELAQVVLQVAPAHWGQGRLEAGSTPGHSWRGAGPPRHLQLLPTETHLESVNWGNDISADRQRDTFWTRP